MPANGCFSNGLGTRMGREEGSDVHRNRVRFSGFGATFGPTFCVRAKPDPHILRPSCARGQGAGRLQLRNDVAGVLMVASIRR